MENVYVLWGDDKPLKGYKSVKATITFYKQCNNLKLYNTYKVCIFELRNGKYEKINEKTIEDFMKENKEE